MRNPSLRWLAPLLIGACGVAGYAAGGGWDGVRKMDPVAKPDISHGPRTLPREQRGRRVEEDVFENFKSLLSGGSKETDIWKVVSRLPVAAIPDALKELRAAQAVTASHCREARRLDEIESALYFHWAELDPVAALADVAEIPKSFEASAQIRKSRLVSSVLAAWMRTGAETAYWAVKDDEEFGYIGRDMLVQTWTPGNVFENLAKHPDKHRDLLGWYCVAAARSPFRRDAMLTALREQPKMKDRDWGYQLLFRSWGYNDFNSAMAGAEAQNLPGMITQLMRDNLETRPQKVMPWAAKNNLPPGGPLWEQGYHEWLGFDGPGARRWLGEQAPVWESKGHSAAVAGFLAQDLANAETMKFTADQEAAARKLTELVARWKNNDPAAAAKWLETAPEAARELLTGKGAGDHE